MRTIDYDKAKINEEQNAELPLIEAVLLSFRA